MTSTKETTIRPDVANLKLHITRIFDAPLADVWRAWTEAELLDLWWAPKPYRAETKSMEFREGGKWIYCMVGPDGRRMWCAVEFQSIYAPNSFTAKDYFTDENGNPTDQFPQMHWKNEFHDERGTTRVEVEITFASEADLNTIVQMGFKEGFTAAHGNLDELLERLTTVAKNESV
jgi:uncharacterized protein YndB with AHSA1/START domain